MCGNTFNRRPDRLAVAGKDDGNNAALLVGSAGNRVVRQRGDFLLWWAGRQLQPSRRRGYRSIPSTVGGTGTLTILEDITLTGYIKSLVAAKGFLFLRDDTGGPDVFCHCSALTNCRFDALQVGDRVSFETERDPARGKIRAVNVNVI